MAEGTHTWITGWGRMCSEDGEEEPPEEKTEKLNLKTFKIKCCWPTTLTYYVQALIVSSFLPWCCNTS